MVVVVQNKMDVGKIYNELLCYIKANKIKANYPKTKSEKNKVNLWELDLNQHFKNNKFGSFNLGDYLARVVVDYMLAKKDLSLNDTVKGTKYLNSIGSNLLLSYQNATIWGSGIEREFPWYRNVLHTKPFRRLDVRAVRGPLTHAYLKKLKQIKDSQNRFKSICYGDPAILLPFIYNPVVEKDKDYIIIPQYVTESKLREKYSDDLIVSMKTDDYKYVIDMIKSSKLVISSSLHGIILAECYGVPAVFFRGLHKNSDFKYKDYYYSTNRYEFPIATSVEEALTTKPLPIPEFSGLQQGLLDSFPYDLWDK